MSHTEVGQGSQVTGPEDGSGGVHGMQDRPGGTEMGMQPGNGSQQMMANQGSNSHMMKQGPGPSPMPQHPGASPQQQLPSQPQQGGPMPGIHFPNVPTTSQSSRPKTPNRASPRPYHHPLTPTNRPPSTEPSEINLSPERLNASIAGLFPPKINIPLPPRQPNLNRGFDQQGLNPTTLKAIGQAPPSLNLPGGNNNSGSGTGNTNNGQQTFSTGSGAASGKQDKQPGGQGKRASPSNSRRSSPASSRKSATPSPGRQKGAKVALTCPPHHQQMVNVQGQSMMVSPSSVPPSPVSMPSQASVTVEPQQTQSSFHGMQGNPSDGIMSVEQRLMPQPQTQPMSQTQPLRDLSAPRMASPCVPVSQDTKAGLELQAATGERQPTHPAPLQDSETLPALRDAPTSLNQLLDNTSTPSMLPKPAQSAPSRDAMGKASPKPPSEPERQLPSNSVSSDISASVTTAYQSEPETKPRPLIPVPASSPNLHSTAMPNFNPNTNMAPNTTPSLNPNPISSPSVNPTSNVIPASATGPAPNPNTNATIGVNPVSSVIQISSSSSTISLPSPITVFVTMTSAPTSQAPPAMVAVSNKNNRPQDIRQQTPIPRPPHFITNTPVFINPIFQVPGTSVAPNTTAVSQPVTMVGPIQVSTANIQLSPAPGSTQTSGANVISTQPARTVLGQVSLATTMSSTPPAGTHSATQQTNPGTLKTENVGEAAPSQKSYPIVSQPSSHLGPPSSASSHLQPPLASPPPCSSPGATAIVRKSPMSPTAVFQAKRKPSPTPPLPSTSDPQKGPEERPAQPGPGTGAVPLQVSLSLCTTPVIQKEAPAPQTTTGVLKVLTPPPVTSTTVAPAQVVVPTESKAPTLTPASVSAPVLVAVAQAPAVTTTSTVASSATSLPTPAPAQSPVLSTIPTVTVTVVNSEVPQATSSPAANNCGASQAQSDTPATEASMQPAQIPAEVQTSPALIQQETAQSQERAASDKTTAEEASTGSEQGWAKKRKTPINLVPRTAVEKPKGPSRRSSRADKEVDEEPAADSGMRKRSARPGTTAAAKETGASPTQAKRRKSK